MYGKLRSEQVYLQGGVVFISCVDYFYKCDGNYLDNKVKIIDGKGVIGMGEIGVCCEVVVDF